ncbi:MAG: isocitrate/isopropylmalate dehydrogenase family protein [Gammaproteobacteria bacterium]|nr:isocitrate/isopropylmalate dehydrogenase family protein [Gammaproteobacteria bacterium]
MSELKLLCLPCDGIGHEITAATLSVLDTLVSELDLQISVEHELVGFDSHKKYGTTLRDELLVRAHTEFDGVILGPAKSRPSIQNKATGMDLVIYRENTEGFYPDRNMYKGVGEMMPDPDMALSVRKITRRCCMRICRQAFSAAAARRKKIAAIHKANVFLMTDGLFLECFREVSREFPEVQTEEILIDAFAALLVRQPEVYDVVVTTNFYGDTLSDLASELSGSLGLAGSINANAETGLCMAQAQHGSAPDIAGKNIANPTSLILSLAMMLEWLGDRRGDMKLMAAGRVTEMAVDQVLDNPHYWTRDLGGSASTAELGGYVSEAVCSIAQSSAIKS